MNFVALSEFLIIVGSFGWFFIHALPPIIYLTLNQTIRRDTIKMLGLDGCCGNKVTPARTTNASSNIPGSQMNQEATENEDHIA